MGYVIFSDRKCTFGTVCIKVLNFLLRFLSNVKRKVLQQIGVSQATVQKGCWMMMMVLMASNPWLIVEASRRHGFEGFWVCVAVVVVSLLNCYSQHDGRSSWIEIFKCHGPLHACEEDRCWIPTLGPANLDTFDYESTHQGTCLSGHIRGVQTTIRSSSDFYYPIWF